MKIDLGPFRGKKICVALSGGGDSMALLEDLLRHAAEYSVGVCAAHLEHGIRGEQSKKDAAFVRNINRGINQSKSRRRALGRVS